MAPRLEGVGAQGVGAPGAPYPRGSVPAPDPRTADPMEKSGEMKKAWGSDPRPCRVPMKTSG